MALDQVVVTPDPTAPTPRVERFLAAVDARLDGFVAAGLHERLPNFAPSAYRRVHGVLAALARPPLDGELFLEWGSALGAVAGMAASLGFRASGIEIDHDLFVASCELLTAHGLSADLVEGSFVPAGHEIPGDLDDPDTNTLKTGLPAYDLLGRDLDEFAIVYAFPWPDLRDAYLHIFDTHAASGALLLCYDHRDGISAHRKRARRRPGPGNRRGR